MRRQDRQISEEEAVAILASGEYGVLSTVAPNGAPYGLPLNYCLLEHKIYFHVALVGKKLEHIAADPRVSFCVVGKTQIQPEKFSTRYKSCIVEGVTAEVFGEEKLAALIALVAKYSPDFTAEGAAYIDKAAAKTRVFAITVTAITGKARR